MLEVDLAVAPTAHRFQLFDVVMRQQPLRRSLPPDAGEHLAGLEQNHTAFGTVAADQTAIAPSVP